MGLQILSVSKLPSRIVFIYLFIFFVSSEVDEVTHKLRGCPEKKVPSQYYVGEKTIDSAMENEKRFGPFLEKM